MIILLFYEIEKLLEYIFTKKEAVEDIISDKPHIRSLGVPQTYSA